MLPLRRSVALLAVIAGLLAMDAAEAARRVALVIGNDAYQNLPVLEKAASDAEGYADLARSKGFDQVIERTNLSRQEMDVALAEFLEAIQPGDVALFVYSGHGWSDGGQNYLVGVDAPKSAPEALLSRISIPLQNGINGILDEVERRGASLKVAIVDACRDNPFAPDVAGKSIGVGRGLTRIDPPHGTFVVFSAGTGQVALDRLSDSDPDPNGVFTRTFLPLLQADLPLLDAVKAAQQKVFELARLVQHDQEPAYYDQVRGEACLSRTCGPTSSPPDAAMGPDAETKLWTAIADSKNATDFEAYLSAYPDGAYAPLAKSRLAALTAPTVSEPAPEPKPVEVKDPGLELLAQAQAADRNGNIAEAVRLYRLASEQGNARATALLGYAYENGRGVKKNNGAAFELFSRAAAAGDVQGTFSLAWAYNNGIMTTRDTGRSAELFLKVLSSGENADFYKKVIFDFAKSVNAGTIRSMQQSLKARGLYSGSVDGQLGPGTKRAIEALIEG